MPPERPQGGAAPEPAPVGVKESWGAPAFPGEALPPFVQSCGQGVYAVDTGFHRDRFDAAYLLVHGGRAAFIDTGTNFAVPRLLQALRALGLDVQHVDFVIPTHVHLDHAGGVGLLMQQLPQAQVVVHPRGARHMIDPTALYQGALAVYGAQEMERSYGALVAVPADRLQTSEDGGGVELAGRPLRFMDTPGHARHHHCIWDEATRGWFTGDTFGLSYREFDTAQGPWILPTTTPVQFEPEALVRSIERLCAFDPQCVYLTHFGRIGDLPRVSQALLHLLQALVARARALKHAPDRHEALKRMQMELFTDSLGQHGCTLPAQEISRLLAMDLELNAQGLALWLDR